MNDHKELNIKRRCLMINLLVIGLALIVTITFSLKTTNDTVVINKINSENTLLKADNQRLSEDNVSLNDKVWHLNVMLEKGCSE